MARDAQIQVRRDTAANWTSVNPTLASGEMGFETDTYKFKIGDGTTAWTTLGYQSLGGNYDGGSPTSVYGGVAALVAGTP